MQAIVRLRRFAFSDYLFAIYCENTKYGFKLTQFWSLFKNLKL